MDDVSKAAAGSPVGVPDLSTITLLEGGHKTREEGMCVMEAVAWAAGEPHSDHPQCACPALAVFARKLNDRHWPGGDPVRTEVMRPLIMTLVGSRSTQDVYERRGFFFADRAVRELAPMVMDLRADRRDRWKQDEAATILREAALKLRAVPEIVDKASAAAASAITLGLRDDLWNRRDAAWQAYAAAADADVAAAAAAAADADVAAAAAADVAAAAAAAAAADAADVAARLRILRRAAAILAEAAMITAAPGAACGGDQKPEA